MDLSAQIFTEVVSTLKSDRPAGTESDKRRVQRAGLDAQATIIPLCERTHCGSLNVHIRDLSPSGMGFLIDRKLSLDEQFALVLPSADDTPAILLCEVAFWQPLAQNLYAIGARFVRLLRNTKTPLANNLQFITAEPATQVAIPARKAS